jgi:hypothetical protein
LSSALDHVLWVGGAQGAGKSTAARAFAHNKGQRLYFVGVVTYVVELIPFGLAALVRWIVLRLRRPGRAGE